MQKELGRKELGRNKFGLALLGVIVVGTALLSGCSTPAIVNVTSQTVDGVWQHGGFWASSKLPDSELAMSAEGNRLNALDFSVRIKNTSADVTAIDPALVRCNARDKQGNMIETVSLVDTQKLIDRTAERLYWAQHQSGLELALDVAEFVADVAAVEDPETRAERRTREDVAALREAETVRSLENRLEHYRQDYLLRHDLPPGDELTRRITCQSLPRQTHSVLVQIPVGSDLHQLDWQVDVLTPAQSAPTPRHRKKL